MTKQFHYAGKSSEEAISKEIKLLSNEKVGQSQELSSEEYKLPLVWIDLEMTGTHLFSGSYMYLLLRSC